ncbi:MAG: hypothetical protein A2174_01825 [Candidatus Portnoybacteria bacterium RBG_13_41_18]|uniref:Uncharacterized protein n=1 Tax=Candidatus Portnoybacteria bacterium RBG_13_41_18 TaxID=1801991 RepID=A0A1G2F4Z7_9BACT|nr:MAG: hypothetical protein A2174_01825 [Candidatus Portnoybacteria bacterium RBG_13_41_18]
MFDILKKLEPKFFEAGQLAIRFQKNVKLNKKTNIGKIGIKFLKNIYGFISRHHADGSGYFINKSDKDVKSVPFHFEIKLPSPRYGRIIVKRNNHGRILRSVPE